MCLPYYSELKPMPDSSNISNRLRQLVQTCAWQSRQDIPEQVTEAADEIDRLKRQVNCLVIDLRAMVMVLIKIAERSEISDEKLARALKMSEDSVIDAIDLGQIKIEESEAFKKSFFKSQENNA